jgi:uncharacterized protein (DUF1697 family)
VSPRATPGASTRLRPGPSAPDAVRAVAFLRGVNVGGHRVLRTPDLLRAVESVGLAQVSAFRASGNVRFTAPRGDPARFERPIADALAPLVGHDVGVFVRSEVELRRIAAQDPWRRAPAENETPYVSLLAAAPSAVPRLPWTSPHGEVELLRVTGREAYSWGRHVGSRPGFPNDHVEKELGTAATTRNLSTIRALVP